MKRSQAGKRGGSVTGERYKRNIYQAMHDPSLQGQIVRVTPKPTKYDYYLPVVRLIYIALFIGMLVLFAWWGLKASGAIK